MGGRAAKERRLTDAQRKLVEDNEGLAVSVVTTSHVGKPMSFDDRISVAYEALINAALCYDPGRGYKFSTYAVNTIKYTLIKEAHLDRLIHLPTHIFCKPRKALPPRNPAEAAWRAEQEASLAERVQHATRAAAVASIDWGQDGMRIDLPDREDTTAAALDREAMRNRLEEAIEELPHRLKVVIQRRRKGISLIAIGNELHVCKERVRQLEAQAIDLLRAMLGVAESPAPSPPKEKRARSRASWSESLRDWV